MRSHPYEPPPPFPPILNSLAALLPEPPAATHQRYHADDHEDDWVQLAQLDHDTSRLVPEQKQRHHVWIQGRLAPVRSVSTANLTLDPLSPSGWKKRETIRDLETPRRRSLSDAQWPDDDEEPSQERQHAEDRSRGTKQSTQLRGYGIGGVGNIRRPTDVIHGPTKQSESLWATCFWSCDRNSNDTRWCLRDMFSRRGGDRKRKGRRIEVAT